MNDLIKGLIYLRQWHMNPLVTSPRLSLRLCIYHNMKTHQNAYTPLRHNSIRLAYVNLMSTYFKSTFELPITSLQPIETRLISIIVNLLAIEKNYSSYLDDPKKGMAIELFQSQNLVGTKFSIINPKTTKLFWSPTLQQPKHFHSPFFVATEFF